MLQPKTDLPAQISRKLASRIGATAAVAPLEGACPNVNACWQLARMSGPELRRLAGFSLRTGRINRLALRMRRAGAVIRAHPELIGALTGLPLKTILERTEVIGKGAHYSY